MPPFTARPTEYVIPAVASGSVSGLTVNGAARIVMPNALVAFAELPPLTRRLNWKVPQPMGVPPTVPVEGLRESPDDSEPEATDHKYGGVPPVAVNVCEYTAPVEPGGKADGDAI
ncbi:MAG: hypothetical protein DMG57_36900 [Acidobacteria bacterium]|nr:MAG: hypothetical protein DMG57_36900 [Acidobacteriota bacterium]